MRSDLRLLCPALLLSSTSVLAAECFDEMPGEIGIRFDPLGRTKITELVISGRGEKAFVATEYLGSSNLPASIYLSRDKRFCLAGDLGAAVGTEVVYVDKKGLHLDELVQVQAHAFQDVADVLDHRARVNRHIETRWCPSRRPRVPASGTPGGCAAQGSGLAQS